MSGPGAYDFQPCKKGDTYVGFKIAEFTRQSDDSPLNVTSARLQIKPCSVGAILHEYSTADGSMTIVNGNELHLADIDASVTAGFSAGNYVYDLEVLFEAGNTRTMLAGTFVVTQDVTR